MLKCVCVVLHRCVEMLINEQMRRYIERLEEIEQLEYAETLAKNQLKLKRSNTVRAARTHTHTQLSFLLSISGSVSTCYLFSAASHCSVCLSLSMSFLGFFLSVSQFILFCVSPSPFQSETHFYLKLSQYLIHFLSFSFMKSCSVLPYVSLVLSLSCIAVSDCDAFSLLLCRFL